MADKEKVEYSFEGNFSSLKSAVDGSIKMLNTYEKLVSKVAKSGRFESNLPALGKLDKSIKALKGTVQGLNGEMSKVDSSKMGMDTSKVSSLEKMLGTLRSQMDTLAFSSKVSGSALANFERYATQMKSALGGVSQQVQKANSTMTEGSQGLVLYQSRAQSMSTALSTVMQPVQNQIAQLSSGTMSLAENMQSLSARSTTALNRMPTTLATVSAAMRRVTQSTGDADSAATRASRDFSKFDVSLGKLLALLKKVPGALKAVVSGLSSMLSALTQGSKKIVEFVVNVDKATQSSNLLKNAITGLTTAKLGEWLKESIKQSINFIENQNLFRVAMGSSVESAAEFVDKMSEVYGMDPSNLMRSAGYFYQLADAISMPDEASKILSLSLTKASNDIASLFNVDVNTVVENLASGMQGMSRSVRKYGMDIRTTTLQTKALELGLTGQVESMSEANRQALRFIVMMEQASAATQQFREASVEDTASMFNVSEVQVAQDFEAALNGSSQAVAKYGLELRTVDGEMRIVTSTMGDFASTIESPANQLRIFQEQIKQLGRAIGDFFIGPLASAMAYINGFVMALRVAITFVGSLLGVVSSKELVDSSDALEAETDAINGVGGAAGAAADEVKKLIAPFDELNVLSEDAAASGGGGGGSMLPDDVLDPALLEAIQNMELKLEEIEMRANSIRDSILGFFGLQWTAEGEVTFDKDLFRESLLEAFPEFESIINEAFESWDYKGAGQIVGVMISGSLSNFADFISWSNVGAGVTEFINNFNTTLNAMLQTIRGEDIGRAIGAAINTGIQTLFSLVSGTDWAQVGLLIADSVNSAVAEIDWATTGQLLVLKFNVIIETLFNAVTNIDWNLVAQSFSTGLASALNSIQWNNLAVTVGTLFQGVMLSLTTFVTTYNWSGLGSTIGTSLMNMWNTIDWVMVGTGLSNAFLGILTFLNTAITTMDWVTIGLGIANAIASIDWAVAAEQFVIAASNIILALINALIASVPTIVVAAADIVVGLVTGLVSQLPLLVQAALELMLALADGLLEALPQLVLAVPVIIQGLVDTLLLSIPLIIQAGIDLLVSLVAALPEIIAAVVEAIPLIIDGVLSAIFLSIPLIVQAGIDLLVALIQALPEIIATLITAIPQIIDALVDGIAGSIPELMLAGLQLFVALIANLPEIIFEIIKAVPQIVVGIVEAFAGLAGSIVNIGVELITGIWDGIVSMGSWLWDKVSGFFGGLVDGIKGFFGIHSPSRLMAGLGDNVIQGFSNGMENNTTPETVLAATFELMQAATAEQQAKMSAWAAEVTSAMLLAFQQLYADMLTSLDEFCLQVDTRLSTMKSSYETWATSLAMFIKQTFQGLWILMLSDTQDFASELQSELNDMVSAAERAAKSIASALTSAKASASALRNLDSSTSKVTTQAVSSATSRVALMATGGVVTGPTYAMIGEGSYDEAVIPLGDSPQMKDFAKQVADAVAQVKTGNQASEVAVKVVIGGKEWKTQIYKDAKDGEVIVGATPVKVGG